MAYETRHTIFSHLAIQNASRAPPRLQHIVNGLYLVEIYATKTASWPTRHRHNVTSYCHHVAVDADSSNTQLLITHEHVTRVIYTSEVSLSNRTINKRVTKADKSVAMTTSAAKDDVARLQVHTILVHMYWTRAWLPGRRVQWRHQTTVKSKCRQHDGDKPIDQSGGLFNHVMFTV